MLQARWAPGWVIKPVTPILLPGYRSSHSRAAFSSDPKQCLRSFIVRNILQPFSLSPVDWVVGRDPSSLKDCQPVLLSISQVEDQRK